MVKIKVAGQEITCESGANLRQVLLAHGIAPYSSSANFARG
ncbi:MULTISPECIES: hypothetical protein [unclassified Roseofilum]|nr:MULTISPECIES: hypothetical protein [unclassified Roseofilum]